MEAAFAAFTNWPLECHPSYCKFRANTETGPCSGPLVSLFGGMDTLRTLGWDPIILQ